MQCKSRRDESVIRIRPNRAHTLKCRVWLALAVAMSFATDTIAQTGGYSLMVGAIRVQVSGTVITLTGTSNPDTFLVSQHPGDGSVFLNGVYIGIRPSQIRVSGQAGADTIHMDVYCPTFIQAGAGDDVIWGGHSDDVIYADLGNDQVEGFEGNDEIHGGAGADLLQGGPGNDTLFGEDDGDILSGDKDRDRLVGGAGPDVFYIGEPWAAQFVNSGVGYFIYSVDTIQDIGADRGDSRGDPQNPMWLWR